MVDNAYDKMSHHSHSFYIYKALFKYSQSDYINAILQQRCSKSSFLILEKAFSPVLLAMQPGVSEGLFFF